MAGGFACRSCGVVLPGRVLRCPSCGARPGLGWAWARLALVVVVILGATMSVRAFRSRVDPKLSEFVEAYAGISRQLGTGGTEATVIIDNKGKVPVDVTLRIRALDVVGNVHADIRSGPHRNIPPGGSKTVKVQISAAPIDRWEVDIIELTPASP